MGTIFGTILACFGRAKSSSAFDEFQSRLARNSRPASGLVSPQMVTNPRAGRTSGCRHT